MAARFAGIRNALAYFFGGSLSSGTAPSPLRVVTGNPGAGTYTVTLDYGVTFTADGLPFTPLSTTTPITIGSGANIETVTPTAVSAPTPGTYGTTTFTAVFANAHGNGDPVASATFGLGEAVNDAHGQGGLVSIDGAWTAAGGLTTTVTTTKGFTTVSVLDWRGTTTAKSYTSGSNGANMAATAISLY